MSNATVNHTSHYSHCLCTPGHDKSCVPPEKSLRTIMEAAAHKA